MGGTSTDVALVQDGKARLRRETTVGDVVRAPSVDVRTVGAGGGSIAPSLNSGALRVGPESAENLDPLHNKGGEALTVTDANVVLGHSRQKLDSVEAWK